MWWTLIVRCSHSGWLGTLLVLVAAIVAGFGLFVLVLVAAIVAGCGALVAAIVAGVDFVSPFATIVAGCGLW